MAPSAIPPDVNAEFVLRNKAQFNLESSSPHSTRFEQPQGEKAVTLPPHPLDIRPAGNAYTSNVNLKASIGFFSSLPDELILQVLEFLDAAALRHFGETCKALYAFSRSDDLWKQLFIESGPSDDLVWRGTWRNTYLGLPSEISSSISCSGLFSDALYRPYLCTYTPLHPYASGIPPKNDIQRFSDLSAAEFLEDWTDKPFILTDPVRAWPAYRDWSFDSLVDHYADVRLRAEAVTWPLKTYNDYMRYCSDESPLYLFDRSFVENMDVPVGHESHGAYWIPECFGPDFFTVLGDKRPDSRWLIIGPERSGSTFHKDPNATSAWNAVLRGSKYWIMFPSNLSFPPPPGVYVSEDQSEVTSPLSIPEWLIGFHAEARKTRGCMEGVCHEGEILHVPSGWWHLVVNLSPAIAITQNFVPRRHLAAVLSFLKDKPDQVSGFKADVNDPYATFVQCMREQYPQLLDAALDEMKQMNERKKRKWDELVKNSEEGKDGRIGFSFGFGGGDDDGDEIEIP